MNYTELRAQAQDGDIVFFTVNNKDYLSRLTSWFTGSPYTHAAFLFWYHDRLMIVESTTHQGSRIVTASMYKERNFDLIPAPRPWNTIEEAALAQSGQAAYGWLSAVYIGIREWFLRHNIRLPENNQNRNLACSEFVADILGFADADISPRRLYEELKLKGWYK